MPTRGFRLPNRLPAALRGWWRGAAGGVFVRPWRIEATVPEVDQVPRRIRARRAFLVAAEARRKWLVFDCPCGSGHRILLNLDRSRRPFWTLRVAEDRRFTLDRSVDYRDHCRTCHYFLSEGRVEWVVEPSELGAPDALVSNV